MTMKLRDLVCVVPLFWATTVCLASDEVVGYVKTVQGDASLVVAGNTVKAEPGTPVHAANVLKTGKPGAMGVTLKDNTMLSIGPDTELVVDAFDYAPAQGALKLAANLTKGSLNYVSGIIAKLKPDAVSVRTPSGNIGVRGTHFVVTVTPE